MSKIKTIIVDKKVIHIFYKKIINPSCTSVYFI
jgi:hypothetical protein